MSDLKPFRERALNVIELTWGGPHHVGEIKWENRGDHLGDEAACRFTLPGDMATWDFSELTRLVVACHDQCVRACVLPKMRYIGILLSDRKRFGKDPYVETHPTLEAHVAAIRGDRNAIRALGETMRTPEKKAAP